MHAISVKLRIDYAAKDPRVNKLFLLKKPDSSPPFGGTKQRPRKKKTIKQMGLIVKQIYIGTFVLGQENVDLYGLPDSNGGELYLGPEKSLSRIKIGLNSKLWEAIVSLLLHETMEFLMLRAGHGFMPSCCIYTDTQKRLFIFTHLQFDELCDRQAIFLTEALPELEKAWRKYQKRKKRKWSNNGRNERRASRTLH